MNAADRRHLGGRQKPAASFTRAADKTQAGSRQTVLRRVHEIVDADGKVLRGETSGNLCIPKSWPGQDAHRLWDHERSSRLFFHYKAKYFTGDGSAATPTLLLDHRRVDDVQSRLRPPHGHAEARVRLVAHAKVSEARVVGYPRHQRPGIYAM